MRSVSSGNIIVAPAPNFEEITQKVGTQEEFSKEKAQGIAGDIKDFVSTEQTITPEQAQKLLSIVANLEKVGVKDLAEVKASLTTLARPKDGLKAPQKDPPPVDKAFVKGGEPKGAVITGMKADIIGDLDALEAEPELKKAKNISTEKLLMSSIAKLDFVKPAHSGLDNFLRGLKNFIRNIFTPWIHYKTLGEEDLSKRAAEFGKQNSRLIWQLLREGKEQKVENALTYYIDEANHNMSSGEVLHAVDIMMSQFKKAAKSWQKENLDYISDLPKGHPSKMFLKESLQTIAQKYDIDLSGISADVERNTTDRILDRLKTADKTLPKEQFIETARQIISEELETAKAITAATKKGHILAEVAEPKDTNDYINNLCSMLGRGIPDLDAFLAQTNAASTAIYKDSVLKFKEVLKEKPHKEYGPDDQLFDKLQMLKGFLQNLSDAELREIAKNVTSPAYSDLCDKVYEAIEHLTVQGANPYDNRSEQICKRTSETLYIFQVAVKELAEQRGIDIEFNFKPQPVKDIDTYSAFTTAIETLTANIKAEAHGFFQNCTAEILRAITAPDISGEKLTDLLITMRLAFDNDTVGTPESLALRQEKFNSYFAALLAEQLKHMGAQDLLALYSGINSPKFMTLRIKAMAAQDNIDKNMLLNSLNNLEAAVNMEIAERAIFNDQKSDGLSGQQAAIIAHADKAGFKKELAEQKDEFLAGKAGEWQNSAEEELMIQQYGITAEQFTKVIDEAPFTINLPPSLFFGEDSPFFKKGKLQKEAFKLKNVFELKKDKRGETYQKRRILTEQTLYPEMKSFEKGEKVNPENHPISGALNIGKAAGGAALFYSEDDNGQGTICHIVLKNEVKKRTRFTPRDAFHALHYEINKENIDKLRTMLKEVRAGGSQYGEFTKEFKEGLTDDVIEAYLKDLLDNFGGKKLGIGSDVYNGDRIDLIADRIKLKVKDDIESNNNSLVGMLALKAFIKDSSDVPVSFENIKKLFKYRDDMLKNMATYIADPDDVNNKMLFSDYIEGEIFGGVNLAEDVSEIVFTDFNAKAFPDYEERVEQLEAMGIKVRFNKITD